MATALDLQEQEQLDDLKAFWAKWGNAVTWTVTLALLAFAAFNGWNWYQRDQGLKASAMADALDKAAAAGDAERVGQVFADLKERYPRTAYAAQGGLLAAKLQYGKGQADAAKASLTWVAEQASETEVQTIARLRLAGVLLDAKQYDEALKQLDAAKAPTFAALVADRRGDVLLAQGKTDAAKAAYQAAYAAMDEKVDYRRLLDAKLTALAAAPAAAVAASAADASASGASK